MKNKDMITNNEITHSSLLIANSKRSLFKDILVVVFCLIGSLFFFYLFYTDINRTLSRLNEQPIGTITFRYNTAQRRFIDRLIWDRLRNESPIYSGDLIRTAELSEATITFEHGEIIDLLSNTLVQIFIDNDGSGRIDLSEGGISLNTSASFDYSGAGSETAESGQGRSFTISAFGRRVTVGGGSIISLSSAEDGDLEIAVSEGEVILQTAGATTEQQTISAGSAMQFSQTGEARALPQAAAVSPAPNARFLISGESRGADIQFNWNTSNYTSQTLTRLEVSSDRNFNRILFTQDFSGGNAGLNIPEGEWYWRLYPAANAGRNIPYSKLTVVSGAVPSPVSPAEAQVISYQSRLPQTRFQWTASPHAASYTLEAADNPLMNNPALTVQARGNGNIISYNTSSLGRGTWYWRVTPVYGREFTRDNDIFLTSQVQTFTIERIINLPSPSLISPAEGAVLNIETGRRDILFTWKKETEAAFYTIRISANRNMISPIIEETVSESFYRYKSEDTSLTPGTFYWTVTQTGQEGGVSPAGEARSFNAMYGIIEQRPVFPPANYTIADSLLPYTRFTWKTNLQNTRFQVSDNERFTNLLIDENANNESYTVRLLKTGVYYWRITGIAGNQRQESAPRRFTIVPSLRAPALIKPESLAYTRDGSIVITEGQMLDFNWESVSGAEYYVFRLFRGNQTVSEYTVNGLSHTVNTGNYGDGLFNWEVQGYARETPLNTRIPGLTASQTINIIYLKPVTLEHPYNGMEYSGINASRNPDTMQWASPVPPVGVELIIARDAALSDVVYRRYGAPYSFVMPRLTQGEYYWTVRAETEEGLDITAVTPARFNVLPIPPLPAPSNLRPIDRYTVTAAMLRRSRRLDFSWNSVRGANGYILSIFQGTGNDRRLILETETLEETNYSVEDLRVIGRGDFFWQVEAVFVYEGNFIEQRGNVREQRLIMNIPEPAKIETNETGDLYAR